MSRLTRRILENAKHNTLMEDVKWIIVSEEELKSVLPLIHEDYKEHIPRALEEMSLGIDYAFWWKDKRIVFEG